MAGGTVSSSSKGLVPLGPNSANTNTPWMYVNMPKCTMKNGMRNSLTAQYTGSRGWASSSRATLNAPATTAKSVRVRNGRRTIVDGPFTETKELLAGFNLIEAEDMDDAVRIAAEFPWVETGCVEVRAVQDIAAVRRRVTGFQSLNR